jgi:hypothetical protein
MADIPSNINEMMSEIYRDSLIYANRFEVVINTPMVFNTRPTSTKSLTLRCNSVSVPGRSLTTQNYRFYGPQRQFPIEPLYSGDLSLSYILSNDLKERVFFEEWLNFVCNPNNYKFSFYDNYTTNITVNILNKTDEVVYSAIVEEVYPKQLGDLAMGYERDEFLTQDITLAYRKYTPMIVRSPNTTRISPSTQNMEGQNNISDMFKQIPTSSPVSQTQQQPRQVFGINPKTGRIDRYGSDGTVNGVING